MNYAIIAAGEGSRLANEGATTPKPLTSLSGVPIIERLIRLFMRNNAESISIIINEQQPETLSLLKRLQEELPLNIVVKNTPSSMHSMHALAPYLNSGKFCLTTVDTIFKEKEFREYIRLFEENECDGIMGVTEYIDDEKPLYITTDEQMKITGFHDTAPMNARYISGGIYGLTGKAIETLQKCIENGQSRMRNFQRQLISDGLTLQAFPFGKIIDIDHVTDIQKAEEIISEE